MIGIFYYIWLSKFIIFTNMYKHRASFFLLFVCLCITNRFFAQVTINTPTIGGCAPFSITYTAPANTSNHNWDFGNTQTSTSFSGNINYVNPGTYTITYSGTSGGNPVTFTTIAYIVAKPVASFSISQTPTLCAVKTVTLTDNSTGPLINQWIWTYGDGGTNTFTTGGFHTYGYTLPGSYSVTLQVFNIYGCTSQTVVGSVSVTASPTPVINSVPNVLFSCNPPFTPSFNGSGSLGTNLSYAWSFPGGQPATSNAMTPGNVTYNAQGNYTVSLTVSSAGCSKTATQVVVVNPTTVTATIPSTICLADNYTVSVQANQPLTSWNLGNGTVITLPASQNSNTYTLPANYPATGVYTIIVSAGAPPCMAVLTKTVYVDKVTANFVATPPANSCASPFIATYSNTSSPNATQFEWLYPTWQGDTLQLSNLGPNPSFTLTQNSLNPYVIYKPAYAPTFTLIAISPAGCRDTIAHLYDSITRPTAWFYKDKQEGCAPLAVTLIDSSFVFPFNPVTSYTWCDGAGNCITGTGSVIANQTFTYATPGTYYPFLTIQTVNGCLDASFTETVIVVNPPNISFSFAPTGSICPTQTVNIVNTTAMPTFTDVTHWHVESDNGFFSGCVSDPNPSWNFTHIGPHTFTMSGYVHGCKGTYVSPTPLFVNGPIVQGRYTTNCTNRLSVDFNSQIQGAQTATLNFGDGSPLHIITGNPTNTIADFITHTYTLTGDYTVTLTGINQLTGCAPSVYTMVVTVRDVQAVISTPSVSCINVSTPFSGSLSKDVMTGCNRGYIWYVDNFPPIDQESPAFGHIFTTTGIHSVTLAIKDVNGCTDTTVRSIRISSVNPAFTLSKDTICVNGSVLVTNNTSQQPDPVTGYSWNFGDGSSPFIGANPPAHTYNFASVPGTTYTITLSATNTVGCVLPITHTVYVVMPNTAFFASNSAICIGPTTVTFTGVQGNAGYTLNLGAGITVTSTNNVMTYTFTTPGSYGINLTVQDARGCRATGSPISLLAETTPTANFIFSSPRATGDVICAPVPAVSFSDASQPSQVYTYNWNLGTGNPVLQQSVVAQAYNNTTTTVITISHTVTTPIGCSSAITKTFTIYSPKAKIELDRSSVCLGDPVKMIIKDTTGSGIKGWVWDYGDGSATGGTILATSSPPSSTLHPYAGYPSTGTYSISLIYYSAGFACWDSDTATIKVIKVDANFKRNSELSRIDSVHCLNKTDQFFNMSPAGTSILGWAFGDGAISTATDPTHTYSVAGVYQVTLSVRGDQSCKGLTTKNMTVNPLPSASINAPDSICMDTPVQLNGFGTSTAGIVAYVWRPGREVTDSLAAFTTANPRNTITYSLVVTDGNGCISPPAIQNVYVQMPPPSIQWDTTVVVGQPVPLNTGTGPNYTYTWTPTSNLSCLNCIQPISTTTVNVTYSVEVMDNMGCFRVMNTYSVYIDPVTSVDVPTAFTPNGDGVNDVIYVDGWGIKKLNYFKIFNRWGQLLFESYDIKVGWDGYYKGVPQNMETYIYQVSVETYLNKEELVKTSSFRLIR